MAAVSPRFLRDAHAVPLADVGGILYLAVADPLDSFTPGAAVPVEREGRTEPAAAGGTARRSGAGQMAISRFSCCNRPKGGPSHDL
jgi:hypothetical protein